MTVRPVSPMYFLGQVLQLMIYNPGLSLSLSPGTTSFLLIIVFFMVLGWLKTNSIPADFKNHFFLIKRFMIRYYEAFMIKVISIPVVSRGTNSRFCIEQSLVYEEIRITIAFEIFKGIGYVSFLINVTANV